MPDKPADSGIGAAKRRVYIAEMIDRHRDVAQRLQKIRNLQHGAAKEMQTQMPSQPANAISRARNRLKARPRQVVAEAKSRATHAERMQPFDFTVARRIVDPADDTDVAAVRQR